jgi:ABC-type lipopolysaccharide export system ATPase subunit
MVLVNNNLYIATGLEKPNQGRVWLNDQDITGLPIHKRAAGNWLFGTGNQYFRHLSVQDNILLVLEQNKVPRRERQDRLNALLHEFRLEKVATTKEFRFLAERNDGQNWQEPWQLGRRNRSFTIG